VAGHETTATVELRDIHFAVTAAGEISPAEQVSVRPEVNGRIAELPVDLGDKVKKGALLCRLDDQDLQIERASRLTEIDGAKLQLQKANRAFSRAKQLIADKLIAQEVFEDAKTDYDLATNSLDRAEKSLRLIEDRLTKTKILAPFDCTVLTRPVSVGQTVSGSGGFNAGTEVMSIANLNDMIINAHINQSDVVRLQNGQQVDVQVESVPGLRLAGVVERIAPQAVIRNGIKGFAARILLKDIDPVIRPGMTAVLHIPIAAAENVLSIPLSAVFTEKGDRFAYVKNGEGFERRPITIGLSDYSHAEVQNGLSAGDVVSLEQPADASFDKSRDDKQPADPRQRRDRPGANVSTIPGQKVIPAAARPLNPPANSRSNGRASGS
jgi:RND family efflux transporter MFP subunit